ncbi:PREDICTED: coiled-coil domain-containing protein 127-like [Priapulus caudatus]|uniref:Coiled-coil domain-containing protein 127-like n=1 Tax=Priapulus caudatus TaxID=37621 RepID=A0ABM1E9R8_PRICU|nr:PREDICTED: coiled-coil domain-containing protein 127-like [Priapulus caudatus]
MSFVKSRSEKEKEALIEEHLTQLTCLKINHEKEIRMMCEKHEKEQLHASKEEASKSLLKGLEEISKEEEICAHNTLWKLASFERGIRNVLDIYCSPFKSKEDRMKHEKELLRNTFSQRFGNINMYNDLEHIFKYDQKHCGKTKEENGQLYQVYMKYWSSQIELFKYKNILHRFQTWSNIQGGQK